MDNPAFIRMTLALYLVSLFLMIKSLIKADWSIFIMRAAVSLVTCYLMIVFILSRSFISNFFASNFFIVLKVVIVFDTKKKSSTYTLTILVLPSDCRMSMLRSPLNCLKPMLLKKAITF